MLTLTEPAVDPELRAEWEENSKKNPVNNLVNAASRPDANPIGNFDMAAFLAGSQKKEDEVDASPPPAAAAGGGKEGKKRR